MKRHTCLSSMLLALSAACVAPDPQATDRVVRVPSAPPPGIEQQAADAARASQPRNEHRALAPLGSSSV